MGISSTPGTAIRPNRLFQPGKVFSEPFMGDTIVSILINTVNVNTLLDTQSLHKVLNKEQTHLIVQLLSHKFPGGLKGEHTETPKDLLSKSIHSYILISVPSWLP